VLVPVYGHAVERRQSRETDRSPTEVELLLVPHKGTQYYGESRFFVFKNYAHY
jgi:hypothetical protein